MCFLCGQPHVIHNYYISAGINPKVATDNLDETKKIYGEPLSIEEELVVGSSTERLIFMRYSGFSIIFETEDNLHFQYVGFELHDSSKKIRNDIHVGSSREQIIKAYENCPGIEAWKSNNCKKGDLLWDSGNINFFSNILEFEYDENDIVTKIRYYPGDAKK